MSPSTEVSVEWDHHAQVWRCYSTPDGRTHQLVGCSHRGPKEAAVHAETLTKRRRSVEP